MRRREFVGAAIGTGIGLWAGGKQALGRKLLSSIMNNKECVEGQCG